MITIARVFVRYAYDPDPRELRAIADSAFYVTEAAADELLPVEEFGIDARVQAGSTDVWVIVLATTSSVLAALAAYGSAAEGLDRLKLDVRALRERVTRQIPRKAGLPTSRIETSRLTMGDLGKLDRLLTSVQVGEIPADKATRLAERIMIDAGDPPKEDVRGELASLFKAVPVVPEKQRRIPPPEASTAPATQPREARAVATQPREARVVAKQQPRAKTIGIRIWRNPGDRNKHIEEY